jgi:hypothetical protein
MAERPRNSDKFSAYVNLYYQQLSGSAPKERTVEFPKLTPDKQELGFLGRFVDILSRPMRVISNPAMKLAELPERFDKVKELRLSGQNEAATKESLNAVGSLLASPFTGFFSDDPSNKPYWSDIIEKQSDVQNRNDPNYVDVADNVDPKIKGALGFIGDVALDPLWLVPGGWAAKAAAKGSKEGAAVARGITTASPVGIPREVDVVPLGQFRPDMKAFGAKDSYDLITNVNGKITTRGNFSTMEAAREAAQKLGSRKGGRPWVETTSRSAKTFRGTNTYRIVPKTRTIADTYPAAQVSQKLSDDIVESAAKGGATASETIVKSLREVVNAKTIPLGGKTVGLRKELESFFEGLSKAAPAPKAKPGKPIGFDKWSETALADKVVAASKLEVPPNSVLAQPLGKSSTVSNAIRVYRDTTRPEIKQAIERLLLKPAYEKYVAGVKSGKAVNLLGDATTPTARIQEAAEANVAAIIVRNLKNLDDAERARGAALLGEDLFADLQRFNSKSMAKFLDDIDAVLKETGAIDALAGVGAQTLTGRVLRLFESDAALRAAAEAQLARNIDNIPNATPENVAARVVTNSRSAASADFVAERLQATAANRAGAVENVAARAIAIRETVEKVLPLWAKNQLDGKYQKGVYPYEKGAALKTDPEFGVGRAVIPKDLNADSMSALLRDLMIGLNKFYQTDSGASVFIGGKQGQKFGGDKFIREKERDALVALELAEELLKQQGLAPVFRLDGIAHQMSWSQAWRTVSQVMDQPGNSGSRWLAASLFNAFSPIGQKGSKLFDGTLPPQVFAYAVARGIETGDKAQVLAILMAKESPAGVKWVNGLADAAANGRNIKVGKSGLPASTMIDNIAEGIILSRASLADDVAKNTKEYVERSLVEGKQLLAEPAEIILDILKNPEAVAAQIRVLANPTKVIDDLAAVVPTTELAQAIAKGSLMAGMGPQVRKNAQLTESLASAVSSGDPKKILRARNAMVDDAAKDAQRLLDEARRLIDEFPGPLADELKTMTDFNIARPLDAISTEGYGTVMASLLKFIDPTRRFFDGKYGMHTRELLWGSRLFYAIMNNMSFVNKPYLKSLKAIMNNKAFTDPVIAGSKTTVLQQAFINVQRGIRSTPGTSLREAEDSVRPMLARFFDQTDEAQNALLGNAFFRTGAGREAINSIMEYNKVLGSTNGLAKTPPRGIFFDEDLAFKMANDKAKEAGRASATSDEVMQELLNQWKTWDVQDPIEFMFSINRAMVQLSAEVGFVTAFKQRAIAEGVGSLTPRQGFVRIVADGDSRYGRLLGDEQFYMTPDAAEMFQAIDNLAKSTKQFEAGFGKFVRTVLDPVTDTWKYAITLPRLGHHTRNMVGDMTLTYLAEGLFGSAAALPKTIRLMSYKGNYSDIDMIKAMSYNGITDIPKDSTIMSSGKFGQISAAEIWQELFVKRGILIPARQSEGLLKGRGFSPEQGIMDDVTANALSRGLEKGLAVGTLGFAARGGRMENMWMGLSEGRDSLVRIHHAMQMMEKAQAGKVLTRGYGTVAKPKTLDELYDLIAERVSKYHPDMSTLSVGEKKYMRRLVPFYHWNRGAIQAVTETLLMNPGRVVVFNKASYNIAVAAGINPDSMFDPFPDDQLFPSFLKQQMEGPQFEFDGSYFGVKPGIATFDVMNQFASGNPMDTLLDNANPAFKIPIELLTGTRLGTQSRIRDYSDYIDSSIPGVNYVANISGKSVTGSFYSLLTGGGFDPQYQFEIGNKGSREQFISALNWLTGIGLTDYSRPNYIRFAEQELQRKNREQRGF